MKKFPKPWFRPARGVWYVTLDGVQHNLGPDEQAAQSLYFELLAKGPTATGRRTASSQTVASLIDDFLDWCQNHRAERSYLWYQTRLQSFLLSIPAGLLVSELRPFHLTKWVDAHPAWNDTTRRGSLVAVLRTCNWGVREGHLEKTPLKNVELPQAEKRERVISPEEYATILSYCTDAAFRDLLTVAWECGPRPQELVRVEARHVDLELGRWVFPVKESKGKRRERVIYLTSTALAITKQRMARYQKGPLFRNRDGKPWDPNTVDSRFKRLRKKLRTKICLYLFRHSWMTRLLKSGVDPITVSTLAGHACAPHRSLDGLTNQMNESFAIETRQLSKVYGSGRTEVKALREASLRVPKGKVVALLGPSGSGKSTLLTIVGLVDMPTSGQVFINGQLIVDGAHAKTDLRRFRRRHIGFVFQKANLIPFLSAVENVQIAMEINGVASRTAHSRASDLLKYLGVIERAQDMPARLSGGEQQRVAVARALSNNPNVLLADEPTASLNSQRGRQVMELFAKVAHEQDAGVIVVTHDHRCLDVFDTIYELEDGVLREQLAGANTNVKE